MHKTMKAKSIFRDRTPGGFHTCRFAKSEPGPGIDIAQGLA